MPPTALERLQARLGPHRRTTWAPRVEAGPGPLLASRYGGAAWLSAVEPEPRCGRCGQLVPLVVQLLAAELPPMMQPRLAGGLLQLFYCEDCGGEDGWRPGGASKLVRVVALETLAGPSRPATTSRRSPQRITGWTALHDHPDHEDRLALGLRLDAEEAELSNLLTPADVRAIVATPERWRPAPVIAPLVEKHGASPDQLSRAFELTHAKSGDKLGGWPAWTQSRDVVACPDCAADMDLVFQLAAEPLGDPWTTAHVPRLFAADGTGQLLACRTHPSRAEFVWACG